MKKICFLAAAAVIAFSGAMFAACDTTTDEEPIETAGQSTVLSTSKSPSQLDADDVAYAFIQKQSELTSYTLTTTGETVADISFITYTQTIENVVIKNGDEYFQQAESSSAFVNMSHQTFVKGDSVAYRNATSGEISTATKSEYKAVYGISPDDLSIGGYIFNNETIKYAELASDNGDGTYTYRYVLDGETAGANAKLQMKQFGSLSGYPAFSSLTLLLTVGDDWTPVSIVTTAEYTITMSVLGEVSCTQNLTCVYSDVNGTVTIPDDQAFNEAIGSTPSDVSGTTTDKSLYIRVAEAAASIDWNTGREIGLSLSVSAEAGETEISCTIPADIYVKYNQNAESLFDMINFGLTADLSDFPFTPTLVTAFNSDLYGVCEYITEASLYYIGDGNLYVTLSGDGVIYLVDYTDLTPVIGSLLSNIDITSASNFDIDSIFEVLNTLFVEDGDSLTLSPAVSYIISSDLGIDLALDLTAGFSGDNLKSLTLNLGLIVSDMQVKFSAGLSDEGAISATKIESVKTLISTTLADDEAAAKVREGIANLNAAKLYGEDYYLSEVKALQNQYAALTETQKALVINYNLLPDENGVIYGALLTAFNGFADFDYSTGVCMSVDLNIGLLANLGLDGYAYGDLYFKYNAEAVEEGDLLGAVTFRLDVDLSNYGELLEMIQYYAADSMPFDAELLSLTDLSIYYTGDGILYISIKTDGTVIYFNGIDLTELFTTDDYYGEDYSETSVSFAGLLPLLTGIEDPVTLFKALENELFTETDSVNGTVISLNESYVEILAAAYDMMVEAVLDSTSSMGTMVTYILESVLSCDITEVNLTINNAGAFRGVSLVVGGKIEVYGDMVVPVLGIDISVDGVLTDEMDGDDEYVSTWTENAAAAYEVYATIQYLTENIWIGDDYLAAVNSAKAAFEALSEDQQPLVINAYVTENNKKYDIFGILCDLHDSLKTSADNLLEGFDENGAFGTDFTEDDWATYNACYAEIKDYEGVLAYVTEARVDAYNTARYNYEKDALAALKNGMAQTMADYAAEKISLQDALAAYYGEYKVTYATLGDYALADVESDYNAFVIWVLGENYKGVTTAIYAAYDEMNALIAKGSENVTYAELAAVYKNYAAATAWYTGSDMYNAYLNGKNSLMYSYVNWMNDSCPEALATEYAAATAAYSAIYSLTDASAGGAFIKDFATVIVLKEYAEKGYPTSRADAQSADLSGLTLEQAQKLYEDVSVMYYITNQGGASVSSQYMITGSDGTTKTQARLILSSYRTTISTYIATLEAQAE